MTVDEYIAQYPEEIQERLKALRQTILETAPEAQEKISWGMPTYMLHGTLIHFAAQKHHIGLYPGSEAVEVFTQNGRLEGYKTSKGGIQLPFKLPLPLDLVKEITAHNAKENTRLFSEKKAAKKGD